MAVQPDLILQLAHHIARDFAAARASRRRGPRRRARLAQRPPGRDPRRPRRRSGARAGRPRRASAGSCRPRPDRRRCFGPFVPGPCDVTRTNQGGCFRLMALLSMTLAPPPARPTPTRAPPRRVCPRPTAAPAPATRAAAVDGDGGAPVEAAPPPLPAAGASPLPDLTPPAGGRRSAQQVEELTVVGTRESRTAGSAHVLRPRDLERMDYDNPETVVKSGQRRLHARRGRLRPASQHRHPRHLARSQQEDHADGGRAPVRPRAVFGARRVLLSADHAHGAGARDQGAGRDQLRPADDRRRDRSRHAHHSRRRGGRDRSGGRQLSATASCTATSAPAPRARATCIEGRPPALDRVQGDRRRRRRHRLREERVDVEGALPPVDRSERLADRSVSSSATPTRTRARATSASPTPTSAPTPIDATSPAASIGCSGTARRSSATYHAPLRDAFTVDAAVYRNDFSRTWRKFNRIGPTRRQVSTGPRQPDRPQPDSVQRADRRERHVDRPCRDGAIRRSTSARTSASSSRRACRWSAAGRGDRAPSHTGSRPASAITTTASIGCTPKTAS